MTAITHPRQPPGRGQVRPGSWWGRAWSRTLEEAAYAEADLRSARSLVRQGAVGQVTVDAGSAVAAVLERDDAWTVRLGCARLPAEDRALFVELVAARSGRVAALLAGDLPHDLVEDGEESGLELLPYAGDLSPECACDAWVEPCRHALAVGYLVGRLLDRDPFVLLHLRGLGREELLAELHALGAAGALTAGDRQDQGDPESSETQQRDLVAAGEAADRARRVLELLAEGRPFEHLL